MVSRHSVTIGHVFFMLLHFAILVFLVLFSYVTWDNYNVINNWPKEVSNLAILLLVLQLLSFRFKKVGYTDFKLCFIGLSYLFMFGRVFLHAYGLDEGIFWNLITRYSPVHMYHAGMFILCSIQSLFIGFILSDDKKKTKGKAIEIWKEPKNDLIYKTGLILLIFSAPFRLFADIRWIVQAQTSGSYSALTANIGLVQHFAMLTVPAIIYIIASGKVSRQLAFIILSAMSTYFIFLMILTGDRRYPVTAIIALLLFYIKLYDIKMKLSKIVVLGFGTMIFLNILTIIRNVRLGQLMGIGDFFKTYGTDILFNMSTLYETLAEFGLSFFSVVHVFKYVPEHISYKYGFTFVGSVPSILPIGWLFRDFFSKMSISGMINPIEGAPVGATLIGDLYANFGWLSVVAGIVVGFFASRIFKINSSKNNRLECAKYYSLFFVLINLLRATFIEIFRPAIMVYYIPLFIMWVLKKSNFRNVS